MDYYNNNQNETGTGGFQNDPFSSNPFFPGDIDPLHNEEMPNGPKKRKPMSKKTKGTLKIVALCLVCALAGGLVANPLYSAVTGSGFTTIYTGNRTPTQVDTASVNPEEELTMAEIYAKYVNSCVGITVDIVSTNIFGQTVTGAAAGSGFVITEDGYILTNYHVIDGASSIKVTFADGTEHDATYVGGEEANDIAVIKINATGLTPVVIGSSSDMLVGEEVTTIGNPLGELTFSQTSGIISALNRTVTMSDGRQMNMIQTDCAINSGNSGGPLFNNHGEVIGIVSAKYSSASSSSSSTSVEGLGFAIPMDDVADMVSQLVSNGYVSGQPILGVSVNRNEISQEAQAYGVPAGAEILVVTPGLCGEEAGLQAGDIVTQINDTTVSNGSDLINAVANYSPGDTVTLTVYRTGETLTLQVTLDESTPETEAQQEQAQQSYKEQQQQQSQTQQQGSSWPFGSYGY